MSNITCGKINHSTNSANNISTTRTSTKANKPFCSLAYLAKSTVAINGNNDIRVANGHSNCPAAMPNVAVTAKVTDRGSPSLPTGTATIINDQQSLQWQIADTEKHAQIHNANVEKSSKCNGQNEVDKVADVFGVINEEDKNAHGQVDDDILDVRRPWELANGSFVRRVPSSLMTTQQNALNGLASLTKLNSLDCWDYTIELECLNGPQVRVATTQLYHRQECATLSPFESSFKEYEISSQSELCDSHKKYGTDV
uniref:Uncharacterized protein n=1 Tax=Glossina austeni TaxID=7395 RepID=A0A1A9UM57_GLOAU